MRATSAVLSPRATPGEFEDLASRSRLIRGQRVQRHRLRRRMTRWVLKRLGAAVLAAALLGAAGLGVRWLGSSPRFAVAEIEVRGQSRLGQEEIEAASGIVAGLNVFRVDPRTVVARLEALPLVKRAEVIRRYPNHVTLVVEERRPFTLAHAGRLHWVDEQGVDLGAGPRAVALGAPVISGLSSDDLGARHAGPSDRAATGLALLRLLLRSGGALLQQISEVDVSRADGPVLYTVSGVEVRLGSEDWEARLGRLLAVLAQLQASGESVASIDLRFRDQVVLDPAAR